MDIEVGRFGRHGHIGGSFWLTMDTLGVILADHGHIGESTGRCPQNGMTTSKLDDDFKNGRGAIFDVSNHILGKWGDSARSLWTSLEIQAADILAFI